MSEHDIDIADINGICPQKTVSSCLRNTTFLISLQTVTTLFI